MEILGYILLFSGHWHVEGFKDKVEEKNREKGGEKICERKIDS